LRTAESALAEQQQVVARLQEAVRPPDPVPAPAGTATSGEPEACRQRLRLYIDELQEAVRAPAMTEQRRVNLLERGTVLAADASRLGVCRPATVRALLDAVDTLNGIPTPDAGSAPVATLVREVVVDLDVAAPPLGGVDAGRAATELRTEQERLDALEQAGGAARSRALAVFAELESVRRSAGPVVAEPTGAFSTALRSRLGRPMPTSWVGPSPIIVDDALAACPADEVAAARAVLLEVAQRAQVVYITADADALAWASHLPADQGAMVRPATR
jgi:hypothetical protein